MFIIASNKVSFEQLSTLPTPAPTPSHTPVAHSHLVTSARHAIGAAGFEIVQEQHATNRDGLRYFGGFALRGPDITSKERELVLGLRNSHDKTFPAGLVAGASVFVCDNLSFSGEIRVTRKHTRFIRRDLVTLVQGSIGKLMTAWNEQDQRIEGYKDHDLTDEQVHDIVIRSVDVGVLPNRKLPDLLKEWRQPSHEEFNGRNAWSLFNSYTEVLKGNLAELPRRTERLHGLLDSEIGWWAN